MLQRRDAQLTGLVEVFSAWFRTFGYTTRLDPTIQGESGSHHQLPLLVERDARRIGVYAWTRTDAPTTGFFDAIRTAREDLNLDQALILCLCPLPDDQRASLHRADVHVWEPHKIIQELGEAVLAETCPDTWARNDPLQPVRSRLLEGVLDAKEPTPEPTAVYEIPSEPTTEPPFPVATPPALATPDQQPATEFVIPPAFGLFDSPATPEPEPLAAPTPPPRRAGKPILRAQVSKSLALSLVRKKLRNVDRIFLRLTPYHVFDFEANLLVDGSLDAELRRGRMSVDATTKKVAEWSLPLDVSDIQAEGVDVDEKKIRVETVVAEHALRQELVNLVTRDVVMAEDGDEWSVVVKKKVALSPDDITLNPMGTFWLPVWRLSGKDGFVEIDATSGAILNEEIAVERSDAQLI